MESSVMAAVHLTMGIGLCGYEMEGNCQNSLEP